MENTKKLYIVEEPAQEVGNIISIASYKMKHLSRLHEAALRKRAEIHKKCDLLEKAQRDAKKMYDVHLQKLRTLQQEVDHLEYQITMENVKRSE